MKILVVDDSDRVHEGLEKAFREKTVQVVSAFDAFEAMILVEQQLFDIIILDLVLPKKSGLALCFDLRNKGITTPILMLSSTNNPTARTACLDAGADDFVVKPVNESELKARVRALLRRSSGVRNGTFHLGNLLLDPSSRVVEHGGSEVKLRPLEYGVLELLLRNKGQVIDRRSLLESLWGISAAYSSNRLDVCIRQLRQKLEPLALEHKITTVRGVGYRIVD
jgi:DNA-binding response OmpR family regulator